MNDQNQDDPGENQAPTTGREAIHRHRERIPHKHHAVSEEPTANREEDDSIESIESIQEGWRFTNK